MTNVRKNQTWRVINKTYKSKTTETYFTPFLDGSQDPSQWSNHKCISINRIENGKWAKSPEPCHRKNSHFFRRSSPTFFKRPTSYLDDRTKLIVVWLVNLTYCTGNQWEFEKIGEVGGKSHYFRKKVRVRFHLMVYGHIFYLFLLDETNISHPPLFHPVEYRDGKTGTGATNTFIPRLYQTLFQVQRTLGISVTLSTS